MARFWQQLTTVYGGVRPLTTCLGKRPFTPAVTTCRRDNDTVFWTRVAPNKDAGRRWRSSAVFRCDHATTHVGSSAAQDHILCSHQRGWKTRWHSGTAADPDLWSPQSPHRKVDITFILKNGTSRTVKAPVGVSLLEVAHHHDIPVEGACEASLACSTCHVIFDEATFKELPEASEREDDLLDMAPHLTDTYVVDVERSCDVTDQITLIVSNPNHT